VKKWTKSLFNFKGLKSDSLVQIFGTPFKKLEIGISGTCACSARKLVLRIRARYIVFSFLKGEHDYTPLLCAIGNFFYFLHQPFPFPPFPILKTAGHSRTSPGMGLQVVGEHLFSALY